MIYYDKIADSNTPKITGIVPISGIPGTFINITGDFKTYCFSRDVVECADDSVARITRFEVFFLIK
jgi:hypothetical protein